MTEFLNVNVEKDEQAFIQFNIQSSRLTLMVLSVFSFKNGANFAYNICVFNNVSAIFLNTFYLSREICYSRTLEYDNKSFRRISLSAVKHSRV